MEKDKTTKTEILHAINTFATSVEKRFDSVENRLSSVEDRLAGVEDRLAGVEGRLTGVEGRLTGVEGNLEKLGTRVSKIESQMVTKDYLDDKLADLRGDMVSAIHNLDRKTDCIVEVLEEKTIFNKNDASRIRSIKPFPAKIA
jgi:predicted  nucleic acid-binding Zn-ribbon protein